MPAVSQWRTGVTGRCRRRRGSDYLPQTADSMMKTAAMMAQAAAMTYVVVE